MIISQEIRLSSKNRRQALSFLSNIPLSAQDHSSHSKRKPDAFANLSLRIPNALKGSSGWKGEASSQSFSTHTNSLPHVKNSSASLRSTGYSLSNLPSEGVTDQSQSIAGVAEEPPISSQPIRMPKSTSSEQKCMRNMSSLSLMMKHEGIQSVSTSSNYTSEPTIPFSPAPKKIASPEKDFSTSTSATVQERSQPLSHSLSFSHSTTKQLPFGSMSKRGTDRKRDNASFLRELRVGQETEIESAAISDAPRNLPGSNIYQSEKKEIQSRHRSALSVQSAESVISENSSSKFSMSVEDISSMDGPIRIIVSPSSDVRAGKAFPLMLSSFIPFREKREGSDEDTLSTITPSSAFGLSILDANDDVSNRKFFPDQAVRDNYNPLYLDDPDIRSCRQKKVMAMKGMLTSTIPFVKYREMKKDLDDQFKEKHQPWFNKKTELTLSMIRQVKRSMIECMELTPLIEVATVAMAIVHFEKLVLQNLVTKQNRKLMAASSLLLAFKLSNDSGGSVRKQHFDLFFERVEHEFGISKKALLQKEFSILSHLKFEINVADDQWIPHVEYILRETTSVDVESSCKSILSKKPNVRGIFREHAREN